MIACVVLCYHYTIPIVLRSSVGQASPAVNVGILFWYQYYLNTKPEQTQAAPMVPEPHPWSPKKYLKNTTSIIIPLVYLNGPTQQQCRVLVETLNTASLDITSYLKQWILEGQNWNGHNGTRDWVGRDSKPTRFMHQRTSVRGHHQPRAGRRDRGRGLHSKSRRRSWFVDRSIASAFHQNSPHHHEGHLWIDRWRRTNNSSAPSCACDTINIIITVVFFLPSGRRESSRRLARRSVAILKYTHCCNSTVILQVHTIIRQVLADYYPVYYSIIVLPCIYILAHINRTKTHIM